MPARLLRLEAVQADLGEDKGILERNVEELSRRNRVGTHGVCTMAAMPAKSAATVAGSGYRHPSAVGVNRPYVTPRMNDGTSTQDEPTAPSARVRRKSAASSSLPVAKNSSFVYMDYTGAEI